MSFSCTVGQLVNRLLAILAVSDEISLEALWKSAAAFTEPADVTETPAELDGFQKNVLWRGLATVPGVPLLEIYVKKQPLPDARELTYGALLRLGPESEITLRPTEACQCQYLTNTENYQMLKTQLGEFPFGLLVVIARHGRSGVLNSDLARESGQDIRSLRLRLQKLEAAGLIACKNVFLNKKHTTLSTHVRFLDAGAGEDRDDDDESIDVTRDVKKTKQLIIAALKAAPNNLRGSSDLRKEFKLDSSRSASKFFRTVLLKMHHQGFIEKVSVELPETKQRVNAVQFVKDLPESDDNPEMADLDVDEKEPFLSDSDDDDAVLSEVPVFNKVFPPFHQIFQQVHTSGLRGATSAEICKNLLGTVDYRPFARLLESLPTYLSNSKNLKPFKKYAEPYDETSLTKLYESEGKLRFYKYFSTQFCAEDKPNARQYKFVTKASKMSLAALNSKLYVPSSKMTNDVLRVKKRRITQLGEPVIPVPKKQKLPKKEPKSSVQSTDLDAIDVALMAQEPLPRRRRAAPKSFVMDDAMDIEADSGDDYTPKPENEDNFEDHLEEEEEEDDEMEDEEDDEEEEEDQPRLRFGTSSVTKTATISTNTSSHHTRDEEKKQQKSLARAEGSAKSINRREHLIAIIREDGGAAFKNEALCRRLDERLQLRTSMDRKTLARDIAYLTNSGVLEAQKVMVEVDGKKHEKRILILKDAEYRPTESGIAALKERYAEQMNRKNMKMLSQRLVQSDMKLYVEKPSVKQATARAKRKSRLAKVDNATRKSVVKSEHENGENKPKPEEGILDKIKRTKRPRKAVLSQTPTYGPKRTRRSIKLDKSDATTVYRSVVISKAFSRDAIDFNSIAVFLDGIDGAILKQKWGTLRRSFGGADAVNKGVETFQNMVLQGVDEGYITEQDLVDSKLGFFLDFWRKFDTTTEFSVLDEMPLFATFSENSDEYVFNRGSLENASTLAERIEYSSMRQKEFVLGQSIFTCEPNTVPSPQPNDEVKSILKSIFATGEGNFDPNVVKTVLSKYGDRTVRAATDALTHDKEISYLAFDDTNKFVLGERFKGTLASRVLNAKIFHHAASFKETLNDISAAGKGLILSQGIQSGEIASLLELISAGLVDLTRIDREFKFENYESRLVDKEHIGCDIVVQTNHAKAREILPNPVAVPVKGPCQPLWVDLNAQINKELWTRIVVAILSQVVFRPGIPDHLVHDKMSAVLNYADYSDAMAWLVESGCVNRTPCAGYVATNCWQYILGY